MFLSLSFCFFFVLIEGASTFFPIKIARQPRENQEQTPFAEITAMLYDLPLDIRLSVNLET